MDLQALKESINQLITTINEKFEIKNVKSPWKKDKGANIDSPVYTINKEDKPLGVVYGCFSPFTGKYGHARLLEKGKQEGIEDFIIVSPNKTQPLDNDRNMFTLDQKVKIAEEGCKDLGYNILGSFTSKHHFFLDALYEFAEKYPDRRLVLICGPDRAETYMKHCIPFGEEYELADENDIGKFELLTVADRGEKAVSGTKVREAIRNGDKKSFLDMTGYSPKMWTLVNKFVKKNGVLGESVEGSAELLTEDTHSLHIEDSLLKGKDYIKRMLDFFNQVADTLTGSIDKSKPEITVKIDGAPAITMYSKFPGLKGPGVSTKSIFNATPKVYTTDKEIDDDSRSPELKVKLKAALKLAKAKIIPAGEIWQGDLLFTKGDIKKYTDDNGEKYIYFKPNTLVYALPVGSDGAKKALASDIGIVFHTRYTGDSIDSVKQSNDASTDKLNKIPEWAFVMDARLPNLSGVQTLTDEEAAEIEDSLEYLNNLCSEIVRDGDYETLIKNEDFVNFYIMTLQNAKVDKSEQIDPEAFVEELHNWTTLKMSKEYKGLEKLKTKAGRDKRRAAISNKSDDIHDIIEDNEVLLHKIAEALNIATKIKNTFIAKLNSVNRWVNKVETTFGMKDTNGEGFMVSDAEGNFVKLVDRSAFSYFNRSPDVIKGFDARRGQNESFSSWLNSKGVDTKFSLNEASFNASELTKGSGHTYYGDKLKDKLLAGQPVYLGKEGRTKDFITKDDFDLELLKNATTAAEFDAAYTSKRFLDGRKKSIVTQLFKGDFSAKTDATGEHVTFGVGATMTHIQESVASAILEIVCNDIPIKVDAAAVPKKYQKKDKILQWMITSKPSNNSGICKYVDFLINDDNKFAIAMDNFLFSWGKSIVKIYNSNAKSLINGIFKKPITAPYWHFGHFQRKDQKGLYALLKQYLDADRIGQQKDDIDKSDIVLYFNQQDAKVTMNAALHASSVEEHNEILNNAFFNKRFLGISLKQVGSTFNLVGVNLSNAFTNVMGDEINNDKVVRVICKNRNAKNNTFIENCVDTKKIEVAAKTVVIPIKVNNKSSIHVSNDVSLTLRTKGTERINAILMEIGASAFLGNAKGKFAAKKVNELPAMDFDIKGIEDELIKKFDLPQRLKKITKMFCDIMKMPGGVKRFAVSFADASGYSIETDRDYYQLSAPYIKIY